MDTHTHYDYEPPRPRLRVLERPAPYASMSAAERRRRLLAHLLTEPETVAEALDGLDLSSEKDAARAVARRLLRRLCWDWHLWREDFDAEGLRAQVKRWAKPRGEEGALVAARFRSAWTATVLPEGVEPPECAARLARWRPTGLMNDFEVEGHRTLTRVCRRLADATFYLEVMLRDTPGSKADRLPYWPLTPQTAKLFHTGERNLWEALCELKDRGVLKQAMGWRRATPKESGQCRRFTAKRHREAGLFKDPSE